MPLARYFLFVGGVLLALLFVSDAFLPKIPAADRTEVGTPAIRIHSDRKWPERVVFDTSIPTIVPPPAAQAGASVPAPVPTMAAGVSAKVRAQEALAQLPSSDASQSASSIPTKPEPKLQRKRKIAKSHGAPPRILVAQQPRFGFFDFGTW
jgi:hypothetical protein